MNVWSLLSFEWIQQVKVEIEIMTSHIWNEYKYWSYLYLERYSNDVTIVKTVLLIWKISKNYEFACVWANVDVKWSQLYTRYLFLKWGNKTGILKLIRRLVIVLAWYDKYETTAEYE